MHDMRVLYIDLVFVCRFFLTSSLGYLGCEYQKPWQSSGLIRHAWHATVIIVIFLCIDLPTTCKCSYVCSRRLLHSLLVTCMTCGIIWTPSFLYINMAFLHFNELKLSV